MRRFVAKKDNFFDNKIIFDKEQSSHISRVLRLTAGEKIIVSVLDGIDYYCTLTECGSECEASVDYKQATENEPKCNLVLFQAVIKSDKMDAVIQKATEIGVKKIVPVICSRTVVKLDDREIKKCDRWKKIAVEACKQCERAYAPDITAPVTFKEAVGLFKQYKQKILCYEDEKTVGITDAVEKTDEIAYFIGPEGGITQEEHDELVNAGAKSVSLGKRILRAETAAVVCGGVLLALVGDMDV